MDEQVRREGFQPPGGAFQSATGGGQQQPTHIVGNGGGPVIDAIPEPPKMEELPPPVAQTWPITVRLIHKPIRDNQNLLIKELKFREPTGGDINRCGNPCRINLDGDVIIDERKMTLIMANLSGVLSPLLDAMDPRDWNSCAYRLRNFFLPEVAAW
jgi:hypothetical protein